MVADVNPATDAPADLRPATRTSLSEAITDQLLELILAGKFAGNRLPPERVLCERLNVSRGPVREAITTLQHLGIVETFGKARIGRSDRALMQSLARAPQPGDHRELAVDHLEVRRMVEPETAAKAAERADAAALDVVRHMLGVMERAAAAGEPVASADAAFHVAVAQATGNDTLRRLVAALTETLAESRELSLQADPAARAALAGHRAILAAVDAGDAVAARAAMNHHLDDVERLVRTALEAFE